ncbi:hypothetical protein D187_008255 [Cystobacter fuscus DSM 2262]|uniref:HYDIN/VesB/CFA65-like Ig-like domain-containing protein n=1 Tax=Cystobacter fuscus (strain ATCC 25194 / DSM 2262 / NBRC 100088 / M29) TaxID=1242864 RepID=S9NV04_CYSF2|nr:choice-of-anchor D domain-containing protein [Cystobacter fuscus]EPX56000.1 hypothetical protein D187_008255 [Cystobacter fuscus DSM 2262]
MPANPTLDFGAQRAGTNVEDTVTVTNTGSRPITFSSIGTPNATYFQILEQKPAGASVTLQGGGGANSTLSFRVRFKVPTATEDQVSSSITLTNQDPGYNNYAINLLGSGNKPILPANPTLNFGERRAGTNVEDTVTVTNTGSRPITFSSIGTPNATYFQILEQQPAGESVTLEGGGGANSTLSFRVRFNAPTTPGDPISSSIALVNTDPVYKNYAITLSGRAVKPSIGEVDDVDFEEAVVGGTPQQRVVTITNSGSGPVTFSEVFIEGDLTAFSLVPPRERTLPLDVPPGPTRLTVRFSPTFEGSTSARLKLISSDPAVANIEVDLTGVGVRPVLQVARTPFVFGEQSVGAPGTEQSVTLSNLGSGKLQITNISTGGAPFTVSPSLPFEVTRTGGPGTLTVTFAPTTVESFNRALTFSTNDPDNATVSIELSGAGRHLLKVVEPSSRSLGFGPVPLNDTRSLSVTLSNEGSQAITVQPPVLTGSPFSSTFTANVTLGPNNRTYQFEVRFTPTATGPTSKTVELRSNASNPVYLTLSGTGAQPGIGITVTADATQTELNFGNLNVGQRDVRSLTIENTGDADLVLNAITIQPIQPSSPAQFSTATLPAKRRLPPKDTVAIQVEFVPTVDGLISADLKISSNVAGADVTFPLRGNGLSASIVLPETSLDFGERKLGGVPGEKSLTIRNKGEAELVIHGIDLSAGFSLKPPLTPPTVQSPWKVAARTGAYPIELLFTPTVLGPVSGGALKIYSNDVNHRESSVTLNGTGVDGEGVTDPSGEHLFPVTTVGVSARQNFRITNEGEYPLTLRGATVSNPTAFAVVNFENGRVLQKGGVYNFFVDFVPKFHGEHTGNLSITTDSETRPTLGVALRGNALGPQAFLPSTGYINFGKIPVQSTSVAQLSVQNSGQGVLSIQDITFTNKFASTDGGTPTVDDSAQIFGVAPSEDGGIRLPVYVDAGMTVSIPLTFRPIEKSTREAVVTVKSNAQDVSKDAIGEGTRAILSLSPKILNFNGVLIGTYSQPQTFTLKNIGSDSVDIQNITLSLNGDQVFDIQPAMKSFPLAAGGGEETFSVTFHPTEERSFADVQLTVTPVPKGYHVSSESMTLSGRGILKPISVDSELVFGKRLIRNDAIKPLLIRNETGEAINFVRATVDSAPGCSQFKQDPTQSAGFTLAPFESKPVNVIFTPLTGGAVNCTLKLEFGQFMDKVPVALQGEGINTLLSADKSTLDFGRLRAGLQQRVEQFTLTNLSDDTITLLPLEETLTMGERFTLKEVELLRDGGLEIPGGKSFTVNVEYKPQGETRSESTLLFGTRTPRQDRAVTIHLTGTATKQIVGVNETGLEFGQVDVNGKPASKTVTVTNGSFQAQRVIVSVAQAGSPFSAKVGPSGLDIPAQGSATFQVEFEPKAPGDVEDQVLIKLQDSTTADVVLTVKGAGRILSGHGNGVGCSAGGAWGSASVLALLTLVGLRSRRRRRE